MIQKTWTFEKPNKNWRNPRKKLLTEIEPLQLAFLETVILIVYVWKLRPVDGVLLHICILSLPLCISKVPVLLCHTVCMLHALQNTTESHSAEHATHTGWHKRTGTFEMCSGSESILTWRRTPSTGRNFQTLTIWITVS